LVRVDETAPTEKRCFYLIGTGTMIKNIDAYVYIGTVQIDGGHFVYHVFEFKL